VNRWVVAAARLWPPSGPHRTLSAVTLIGALGAGAFATSSAVFFTRSVGLSVAQVGAGMTAAGVVGVLGSVLAGKAADRIGAREALIGLAVAQAVLFGAYLAVGSFPAFLLVICAMTFAERSGGVVRSTVVAVVVERAERVRLKSYLRSVFNAGVAVGTVAATVPLQLDTRAGYVGVVLANAAAALGSAALAVGLPRIPPQRRPPEVHRWAALRDRPYVTVAVLCGLLSTHHSLLVLAVPIWVAEHTAAPGSIIGGLMLVNTVLSILLQVWAGKSAETVPGAARVVRKGAAALAAACAVLGAAGSLPLLPSAGLLILGIVLLTLGELWTSAAAWGLSFDLASSDAPGQYQGVFKLGMSVEAVAGPAVATALIRPLGMPGWLVTGGLLLLLGLALPAVTRWAAATREVAEPPTPQARAGTVYRSRGLLTYPTTISPDWTTPDPMSDSATYLDHASTSFPKPDAVWRAAREYLTEIGASPGRGGYRAARNADRVIEQTRCLIAGLIGAADESRIAFTANATQALNVAIHGSLRPGDHVVTTNAEHNSVLRPLETLARAGVITYSVVDVRHDGVLDLDQVRAALRPGTRLLVANHASNVTGAVVPAAQLAALAHAAGARFLLDASQTLGVLDLDVDTLDVDLLAFTGHKALRGPSGTGGLFVRDPAAVHPLMQGGTGLNSHALIQPAVMPARFEAGTPNYLGIAGLGAAVEPLVAEGPAIGYARELALSESCRDRLRRIDGVTVYDLHPSVARVPLFSFNVDHLYPSELSAVLDEQFGILTRAGMHCAPLIHRSLGTAPHGTVRVSLGATTTARDTDALVHAITTICARAADHQATFEPVANHR
jgi:cysteine desulfurase/selenocysteine lyase